MKSKGLSAFLAAFVIMLALLAFIAGVMMADGNSMLISGNTGDETALAFSVDGDMLFGITLFNQRGTLDLRFLRPIGQFYSAAGVFYASLLPDYLLWPFRLAPKLMMGLETVADEGARIVNGWLEQAE